MTMKEKLILGWGVFCFVWLFVVFAVNVNATDSRLNSSDIISRWDSANNFTDFENGRTMTPFNSTNLSQRIGNNLVNVVEFDGNTTRFNNDTSGTNMLCTVSGCSFTAWVNITNENTNNNKMIFSIKGTGGDELRLRIYANDADNLGNITVLPGGGAPFETVSVPHNEWIFISVILNLSTGTEIWINGVLNESTTINRIPSADGGEIALGVRAVDDLSEFFEGALFCPRFFNTTLNQIQIASLYNSGDGSCAPLSNLTNHSLTLNFLNEKTGNAFTFADPVISIDVVGTNVTNLTTNNGSISILDLLPGSYDLFYSAIDFAKRQHFFTLTGETNQNIDLYLLDESNGTDIQVTVLDQNFDALENATVQTLKFFVLNNSFLLVNSLRTAFDGTGVVDVELSNPPYKFRIIFKNETKFTSIGTTVEAHHATDGLNFQINTEVDSLEKINELQGVEGEITFNNVTNAFTFSFLDSNSVISEACLEIVELTSNGESVVNSSCSSSSSGNIILTFDNNSDSTFIGQGVVRGVSGGNTFSIVADAQSISLNLRRAAANLGSYGLFLIAIVLIGVILSTAFDPKAAIISSAVGFVVVVGMGLTVFSMFTAMGIMAAAFIVVASISSKKT